MCIFLMFHDKIVNEMQMATNYPHFELINLIFYSSLLRLHRIMSLYKNYLSRQIWYNSYKM